MNDMPARIALAARRAQTKCPVLFIDSFSIACGGVILPDDGPGRSGQNQTVTPNGRKDDTEVQCL